MEDNAENNLKSSIGLKSYYINNGFALALS